MNTKKVLLVVALVAVATTMSWAQRIEVMPFAGYRTSAGFNVESEDYGRFSIRDGLAFGVTLTYRVSPFADVEFAWSRSDSMVTARTLVAPIVNEELFKVHTDRFQANILAHLPRADSRMVPYVLLGLGWTSADPFGDAKGVTRFSFGLGGGLKMMVSDRMGLRFQGTWNPTYVNTGVGIWCDYWGFCYATPIANYTSQGEFTGGLFFRF